MKITAYKTHKITSQDNSLIALLDKYLPSLEEKSVVVITSKIVSICQGRIVKKEPGVERRDLAKKEADYFLPEELLKYNISITIKNNILVASAGIDESNGNGYYILWPENMPQVAQEVWIYLRKKHQVKDLGVMITDSHLTPMRRGLTGVCLAWCGFSALRNYIGTSDIFGKEMLVSKTSNIDSLATAAVYEMGEGSEQTPLAVITDLLHLKFQDRPPTQEEIDEMHMDPAEDVYAALLTAVTWERGGKGQRA